MWITHLKHRVKFPSTGIIALPFYGISFHSIFTLHLLWTSFFSFLVRRLRNMETLKPQTLCLVHDLCILNEHQEILFFGFSLYKQHWISSSSSSAHWLFPMTDLWMFAEQRPRQELLLSLNVKVSQPHGWLRILPHNWSVSHISIFIHVGNTISGKANDGFT